MPRSIYNEGRVVGESAYESYVRHHLSEDPNTPPASEKQWLASSIAMGSSLLLKLGSCGTSGQHSMVAIKLPVDCTLYAANNINAYFFEGSAEYDPVDPADVEGASSAGWANRITDYSQLISNNAADSPSGTIKDIDSTNVPTQTLSDLSLSQQIQLSDYLKIVDGIIIHPGEWDTAIHQQPEKNFTPNFATDASSSGVDRPVLRLHINGEISSFTQVLLTGFTDRSILSGIVGTEDQTATTDPENGDFLGPEDFPWVSKVFFNVPSIVSTLTTYERTLNSPTAEDTSQQLNVKASAVIDMDASNPGTFYTNYSSYRSKYSLDTANPRYPYTINTVGSSDGVAVLTTYQKKAKYPPALYGTISDASGTNYLNPLDIVAPGSIKMFNNVTYTELSEYQSTYPGTWGINRASDGSLQVLNNAGDGYVSFTPSSISEIRLTNNSSKFTSPIGELTSTSGTGGTDERPKLLNITNGSVSGYALLLSDDISTSPTEKTISSNPSSVSVTHSNGDDNLSISSLVYAFQKDVSIDLLGSRLKYDKYTQMKPTYLGTNPGPTKQANWDKANPDPYSTDEGTAHIRFGSSSHGSSSHDIIDMYVAYDEPNPGVVRSGSVGFGWGYKVGGITQHFGSYYQYHDSILDKDIWWRNWGGEFLGGRLRGSGTTSDLPNSVTVFANYAYIIVGRVEEDTEKDLRDVYKKYITDPSDPESTMQRPAIAIIDHWGGVFWISKPREISGSVFQQYEYEINITTSGTNPKITRQIEIINNNSSECIFMVVGNIKTHEES